MTQTIRFTLKTIYYNEVGIIQFLSLFRCQLDIWVAKIATRVDQVVDVFYVRSFDGEKVDRPEQETAIQKTVEAVLL